ncbi:CpaE family protein [Phenylobacterium sp.]|uniref:AAA family ATPase n=1 Tax=Phenylobacterium sp. TaxID=1871053 RepID=UPI0035B30A6F
MALPLLAGAPDTAPTFLATVVDDVTREAVRQAAAQFGWPASRVREGGAAAARELLRDAPAPAVLLVDASDADDVLTAMDALAEVCEPHTRVIALGQANDIGLYRALMRMGVSDYLVKPVATETLAEAIARARRTEAPEPAPARPTRVMALVGARGGVGATSLAVSAAWALAGEHQQKTVLLDLDLQFGAAALSLDLETGRGLREILSNPDRIDSLLIGSAMVQHGERLRVLGAEEPLDEEVTLASAGLQALLGGLADDCDAVVVDLPRRTDAVSRDLLARAETVGVVTDLSLAGMRDAQRLLALLKGLRPEGRILLIANRVGGTSGEVPQAEFERGVGAKLDLVVPHDGKMAEAAAQEAKPLLAAARGGPAETALRKLPALLAGVAPVDAAPEGGAASWMKRLLGR